MPDKHLGMNTAHDLGLCGDEIAVIDPHKDNYGIDPAGITKAKIALWSGFCIVHVSFRVEDVVNVRRLYPDAKIIVHPETPSEVVRLSDAHGSTAQIIKYVEAAKEGSTIVIGTELNLIDRLAEQYKGKLLIKALRPSVCANMAKTNENNLLEILENWPQSNLIQVQSDIVADARISLERMLSIK